MLELVHINPLLYLSNYAPSASVPGLALGCLCSSCRSLQGSMNKKYEALVYTWYYPQPAEKPYWEKNLILCKHQERRKCGHLLTGSSPFLQIRLSSAMPLLWISWNFCYQRLILWGCSHFMLPFSSDSVFFCGGFIPCNEGDCPEK